jgi:soluble lytic murein transglycosylase
MVKLFIGLILLLLVAGGGVGLWQWGQQEQSKETAFDRLIRPIALKEGVDPLFVRALIWRESRFDPDAVGLAQERGLMQVTPIAAEDWVRATKVEGWEVDRLFDPATNIQVGTWYLARAMRRWKETDEPKVFALGEYNAGRSHALRWVDPADPASAVKFMGRIDFPTTRKYIEVITRKHEEYRIGRRTNPWEALWERGKRKLEAYLNR